MADTKAPPAIAQDDKKNDQASKPAGNPTDPSARGAQGDAAPASGEAKPELQPHQYRADGTPSNEAPIVDAEASRQKAIKERGSADIPKPAPSAVEASGPGLVAQQKALAAQAAQNQKK